MTEIVVREHEEVRGLDDTESEGLKRLAQGAEWGGLAVRHGGLYATNYVGIVEASRKTSVVILPKVDLSKPDPNHEGAKTAFLTMLRDWRGLHEAQFPEVSIRDLERFEMWEAFYYLFLRSVVRLAQRGLARRYRTVENNLPFLRGRIRFPEHLRRNLVNRARFFVGYDEFSANRPANRLIRTALDELAARAKRPRNTQLLHGLRVAFADVPPSSQPGVDWERRLVDRSMRHYGEVLPWVGLLLFHHGLATFAGKHRNRALLFPMWEVFEDFVTASCRRHQVKFEVRAQHPRRHLARKEDGAPAFYMMPDISLMRGNRPAFILDAKWKALTAKPEDSIDQSDLYQLFAYGKKYGVPEVALIYPQSEAFSKPVRYGFDKDLSLVCFPFDVEAPEKSVKDLLSFLKK